MTRLSVLVTLCLLVLGGAVSAHAQPRPASVPAPDSLAPANHAAVWAGGSFRSSTLIAKTEGTRLGLIGITYARIFDASARLAAAYTAELIPLALLSFPEVPRLTNEGRPPPASFQRTGTPAYGAGITPLGFRITARPHCIWQPYLGTHAGLLYFPRPIPDTRGQRVNYLFDVSAGVRIVLRSGTSLLVGYRFHHLSNGFQGAINPGFDVHLFYIGLSTFGE